MNPNGIPPQSPGLRAASYPGYRCLNVINPNGVVAASSPGQQLTRGRNPVGVGSLKRTCTTKHMKRPLTPTLSPSAVERENYPQQQDVRPRQDWRWLSLS